MTIAYSRKLIEVALPLPENNDASAYDRMSAIGPYSKEIYHGLVHLDAAVAL